MKRLYLAAVSSLVLAFAMVAVGPIGIAAGESTVICNFVKVHGKKKVSCPKRKLHGKRGVRGPAGPAGPTGPQGAPGATGPAGAGAGSGLTLNFNAKLKPFQVRELVVGNFTVQATNPGGGCANIKLLTGAREALVSIGAGGSFFELDNNKDLELQSAGTSNMFTAVTVDGSSSVSGIVGNFTEGGFCLVSGYVTGV